MNRIAHLAVAVAALASLFCVLSTTAGAVTWHNSGSTAFTATGGPVTFTVGSNSLACSGTTATGTAPAGPVVGSTYTLSGTLTNAPCTYAGQSLYRHCDYTFTGALGTATGAIGAMHMTCVLRLTSSGTGLCHFSGATPVTYTNPSGSTPGRFTLAETNTITVTNSSTACILLGTGSGTVSEHTIVVTNGSPTTLGPVLTRTA